jgi:hypothetical protein
VRQQYHEPFQVSQTRVNRGSVPRSVLTVRERCRNEE